MDFGFSDVESALDAVTVKLARKRRERPEVKTSGGVVVPEIPKNALPGDIPAGILENSRRDDPFYGKKCAIRRCREGVQFSIGGGPVGPFEPFMQPSPTSNDPLVARLEAKYQEVRPAAQVPESPIRFFCLRHFGELMAAKAARIEAARKAAEVPSWALHTLNWEGATIALDGPQHFVLVDGDGKTMRLEIVMHLAECQARIAGKEYVTEVLNREQARAFIARAKIEDVAKNVAYAATAPVAP